MNWLKMPMTDRSSDLFFGYSILMTGSMLRSAGSIFPLSTFSPKNCSHSYPTRTFSGLRVMLAFCHIFRKSSKVWIKDSSVSAPPRKSSAKFAILGNDRWFSMLCSALVYAFWATVAAFLVPMTSLVNWKSPFGVQNAVISLACLHNGIDQYCFRPSAENLYLLFATLYSCCHASVYVGTVFIRVSFTRTPAHVTRMPSGRALFGVDPLYFAARISRDAYDVFVAFSTRFALRAHASHSVITLAFDGGKAGLVS